MATATTERVQRMVRAIVDACDPEQIILFGSRARGDAREDSDFDLLIIQDEPFESETARLQGMSNLYRATRCGPVPTDLLLFSASEVDYWRTSLNHVVGRALREGKVLYERP